MDAISSPIALYLHVPFCRARCAYCDFNTYAGLETLIPAYVSAVGREIEAVGRQQGRLSVSTIYFGGGTPSLLPLDHLADLLQTLRATFHVSAAAEITLEANPGTVTPDYLTGLHALGVNRLSLGAQSARESELQMLERRHTWADVREAARWAREAGFDNLSLDLILGLPGQTVNDWETTLEASLALGPKHLSLYDLGIEEGTCLAERIASGALPAPDEDRAAEMYEQTEKTLAEVGFFHYEISNWGRMDSELQITDCAWWPRSETLGPRIERSEDLSPYVSRHNLTYWRNEPWLGLGAGAHSWLDGRRRANAPHPEAYIAALERGETPASEVASIDRPTEMGETMMLGLRLAEGVKAERFQARFGETMEQVFGAELKDLRELGLITWDGHVARLTGRGRLLGNQVFVRFV